MGTSSHSNPPLEKIICISARCFFPPKSAGFFKKYAKGQWNGSMLCQRRGGRDKGITPALQTGGLRLESKLVLFALRQCVGAIVYVCRVMESMFTAPHPSSLPPQARAAGGGSQEGLTLCPVGRPHRGGLAGGKTSTQEAALRRQSHYGILVKLCASVLRRKPSLSQWLINE